MILFDYLSFTAKHHDAAGIVDLLGMDISSFETVRGARGYLESLRFDKINIFFGGREEVWCEMSGQGCRAFESYGHGAWDTIFEEILSDKDYHITRLDVAFDDRSGLLDLDLLYRDTHLKNYISKFDAFENTETHEGITICHGSRKSDLLFRIYDKARERGREDEGHWVRFEIQMRDEKAYNFLSRSVLDPIGKVFSGVINNYLRYVTPTNNKQKSRWPMSVYWKKFTGEAGKHSLYIAPGAEYNLSKLERYVDQVGAAAATYIEIVGLDAYLEKCMSKLAASRNPKYKELLKLYKEVGAHA